MPDIRAGLRKAVLLNPPGEEIYLRDYYCSKVSKSNYLYTPVDLLIAGARLKPHFQLKAIDAIAEALPVEVVLSQVLNFRPNLIVVLVAAVSWESDKKFLKQLRKKTEAKIIITGDVAMDSPGEILEEVKAIDAVLLDFTSDEIISFGLSEKKDFYDIFLRNENKSSVVENRKKDYQIPIPPHEIFPLDKYHYPFIRKKPFATVLTDFGCKFTCSFCIQGYLNFKSRSVEDVVQELKYLKRKGIREIYFSDQTFGFEPKRLESLLLTMIEEKLNFGWVAFYRVDLVTNDRIELMKKAGCHTLMFGIETANEEVLGEYNKKTSNDQVRKALNICKRHKIRTVGTFILGFPEEREEDVNKTIKYSLSLPLDYASFNLPVPRNLTELKSNAIESKLVDKDIKIMDQSGKFVTMGTKYLSSNDLYNLRNQAIKSFYLRPSYLLGRLMSLKTWDELKLNFSNGYYLLRSSLTRSRKGFS